MKCPECGRWNQASLPRCFSCGAPLSHNGGVFSAAPSWREQLQDAQPDEVYIQFTEEEVAEDSIPAVPTTEQNPQLLGSDMEELKERRKRGELKLAQLRMQARKARNVIAEAPILRPNSEEEPAYEAFHEEPPAQPTGSSESLDALDATTRRPNARRGRRSSRVRPDDTGRTATKEFVFTDDDDAPVLYDGYISSPFDKTYGARGLDPDPMIAEREKAAFTASQHFPIDTTYARGRYQRQEAKQVPQRTVRRKVAPVILMRIASFALIIAVLGVGSYFGFQALMSRWDSTLPQVDKPNTNPSNVAETIMADGAAAHTVYISGKEGTQIYIRELQKSYIVTGGTAEIQIPDYFWYEDLENITSDYMDVTVTPFAKYATGEQTAMDPVRYTIFVPLSPIQLIRPESTTARVSTSLFDIRLQVEKNSRVIINGENLTETIDSNGRVSKNIPVLPIGENRIQISVRSKYHRQNTLELILIRDPQEIPLEMAADTPSEVSDDKLRIYGSTAPGATISIDSEYVIGDYTEKDGTVRPGFDTSTLKSTGDFSFIAIFTKIGDNEIKVRASAEGKADSVVTHIMYYMPPPEIYTKKAWPFDRTNYLDLINNPELRKGQIYVCKGTVTRIISERPQIVEMNTGLDGAEQFVLLENSSKTIWEVGKAYDVYGDAFGGMYGNMPRIIGRYTYLK